MRPLQELLAFLENDMSMSEVYQPAIILRLLELRGAASKDELARTLLSYDRGTLEYYRRVLMRWPRQTLSKHHILTYDKKTWAFALSFDLRDQDLLAQATEACHQKIEEWLADARASGRPGQVQSAVRYRVLKAAGGRCALCGIHSQQAPIDVDHIIPRSKADRHGRVEWDGDLISVNDERNLQALCFRCNRGKGNADDTDFRIT
jgi:5-methylcytosine-specific restriction endonuclease McrA